MLQKNQKIHRNPKLTMTHKGIDFAPVNTGRLATIMNDRATQPTKKAVSNEVEIVVYGL